MRFLLLLPLLVYVGLAFFNMEVLTQNATVSVFGFAQFEVAIVLYLSLFFVIYLVLVFLIMDTLNVFANRKVRMLEKEVFELKSKLYDEREDELVVFMKEQRNKMDNFLAEQEKLWVNIQEENKVQLQKIQDEHTVLFDKTQAETNRIMDKLHLVDKSILDKIKETFKAKN
ncbi:hypothetical protein KGV52_00575 [Candidatus Gracilibacteria bacterium]|nr:hypothetical protein [Candidatus Gracilibacteria bacterium]